ncbi:MULTISPECIES: VOC family protein [unclassified Rhizobium]|uniref:VOC family protein n=1 Tax=unclassified Rhizobium TaxID=2613769 RepID=UPI001FE08634|nr:MULTISPECIES: VOC family protein [unclassified Rhizobium]MDF0661687.1 VOC family protein [Rhizobium sp. BC49]
MDMDYRIDHFSLLVNDLTRSIKFYSDVFGFEIIEESNNDKIRWLKIGGTDTIHLSEGDTSTTSLRKDTHFALRVRDFDAFLAEMQNRKIAYYDWPGDINKVGERFDGYRQVYIQDPDGYWIEVNNHGF